jgi:Ran GTPase-activating protein (RanGAP) involved in mRNA processing and transport
MTMPPRSHSEMSRSTGKFLSLAQRQLEEENKNFRRVATPSSLRNKKMRLFVASNDDEGTLPRPLSPGLAYAAKIADFEELVQRNIWDLPPESRTFLTHAQVEMIFRAKCQDQKCPINFDRAQRFHTLISEKCQGQWFVLRQCGLGINSLRAICNVLESDTNITHLDLSGNTFGEEAGEHFERLLAVNRSLIVLRLQSVNIGAGIEPVARALRTNSTLTAIDLSGIPGITRNTIWGNSVDSIVKMIEENKVLSNLNMANCGLQRSSPIVIKACTNHAALTSLNLSGNTLKDEGCTAVKAFFASATCKLLSLSLVENQITCRGAVRLADALRVECPGSQSLEELHLANNEIGSKGCEALANAIREHPKLRLLDLSHNMLLKLGVDENGYRLPDSNEGLASLFLALESAPALRVCLLGNCGIVSSMPQAVVPSLARMSLEHLSLCENRFGDAGGLLIAEGLQRNQSLERLDISQCAMDASMTQIAASIANHKKLKHVKLAQGQWDVYGCGIIEAVRHNTVLLSIDLGRDALEHVRAALARNKAQKVESAAPLLANMQAEVNKDAKDLQMTIECIVDEARLKDKATDALKLLREKQKAASLQMKTEIDELKAAIEAGQAKADGMEKEVREAEEQLQNKTRQLELERQKFQKKIDTCVTTKAELLSAAQKLSNALQSGNFGTAEQRKMMAQLEEQYQAASAAANEQRSLFQIIEEKLKGLQATAAAQTAALAR